MKKIPFITKDKAEEIAKEYGTPYHVYDEAGIRKNAAAVARAFSWNKGFREYFAVKATPNPFILRIFKDYGFGCDCSSMAELKMAYAAGFKGEEIMFSSNDTPAEEYRYAAKLGAVINFDDITMLPYYLDNVGDFPETVSCRFNPGGTFSISNDIMDNPGDSKYGMTEEQLTEAFLTLKAHGVKHFGIHAFLASNTVTDDYYPTLAGQLFELAVKIKKQCQADISFINLSGGVGIPYRPDQEPNHIDRIGEGVREAYERLLLPADMGDVKVYAEMGRFMLGPYGALVTRAIHEKHIYKEYIGVDACAANL
ncbi:MAG: diaminopimelate decarboxylase, partial [Lachnospiraceae bacterium]|nr:diaminopimelate decarboxylase [Lachnospiraceae bacterium]